jgi:hypothetical protein
MALRLFMHSSRIGKKSLSPYNLDELLQLSVCPCAGRTLVAWSCIYVDSISLSASPNV